MISKSVRSYGLLMGTVALVISLMIFTLPFIPQTRIYIKISRDNIDDVYVNTEPVPLVVRILRSELYGIGAYTLNITIDEISETFTIQHVPAGRYVVWWRYGAPQGIYIINVKLFTTELKDEFTLIACMQGGG